MIKLILFSLISLTTLNLKAVETCSHYMSSPIMQVGSKGQLSLLVFEPSEEVAVDYESGNALLSLTYTEETLKEFIDLRAKLQRGQAIARDTIDFLRGPLDRDLTYSIELNSDGQILSFSETYENLSFEDTTYEGAFKTISYETHYTEDGTCFVKSITNTFSGNGEAGSFFLEDEVEEN